MKSGISKYWRFTDAVSTNHDAADQGIPLTEGGRWRSRSTLEYLKQEGLGTVPANIRDEIAELVENLPGKREDESQRSSSTWRRGQLCSAFSMDQKPAYTMANWHLHRVCICR